MTACPPTRVSSPDSRIGISCKWVNKRKNVLGDTKPSRDFLSIIACRECSPAEAGRARLYGCPILTRRFGRSANGLVHGEGVKTIARAGLPRRRGRSADRLGSRARLNGSAPHTPHPRVRPIGEPPGSRPRRKAY